jgi:uncharacterized protein YwqG
MNNKLQDLINMKDLTRSIKQTLKNYIQINPNPESTTLIPNNYSYFGGTPYMPAGELYPKDVNGNNLQLLIQLNLDGLEVDNATGLLQIFIDPFDELYGMNLSNPNAQEKFKVRYYPTINPDNQETNFEFLKDDKRRAGYNSFFVEGFELMNFDLAPKRMSVTPTDYHFELMLPDLSSTTNPEGYDDYDSKAVKSGHRFGGYPYFIQQDPRLNQLFADYVLLFQIDSYEPYWSWGSNGVATFLIHPDDFSKLDFSKVLFYWDCE